MKARLFLLLCIFFVNYTQAQTDFKAILGELNWQTKESDVVYKFHKNIVPLIQQEVWKDEGTESNYSFTGISVGGQEVKTSYFRVRRDNKQFYRINFILLENETNLTKYSKIETALIKQLGDPIKTEDGMIWVYDNYKIKAKFIDVSSVTTEEIEEYLYVVNIEPMLTYYVNSDAAKVESNNANKQIPFMQYFRIDVEQNVYIKEKGKNEEIKQTKKVFPSAKGKIMSYDNGMFCYRKDNNDIVHIEQGLVVLYPIVDRGL